MSYIGKNPKADSIKLTGTATAASGTDEGQIYYNTGTGTNSLESLTSGDNNACYGYQAGQDIDAGLGNTAIGASVLKDVTTSEVSSAGGTNYTAAGNTLSGNAVAYGTAVASCDFSDTSWTSATITAAFGTIYNSSASNKVAVVLDFSGDKTCTNGTFTISFPSPSTPADAIISMA